MALNLLLAIAGSAALFAFSGCAGTASHAAIMAHEGVIVADAPDDATYDYKFRIKTIWDPGIMDTRAQSDRLTLIRSYLRDACPAAEIIGEQFLKTGSGPLGGERGVYVSKVKCGHKPLEQPTAR